MNVRRRIRHIARILRFIESRAWKLRRGGDAVVGAAMLFLAVSIPVVRIARAARRRRAAEPCCAGVGQPTRA